MVLTKEMLIKDIENKKQMVAQIVGAIQYAESLLAEMDKPDPTPDPATPAPAGQAEVTK